MTENTTVGLRDRKRSETRSRLERCAVEIVLRDGLEHATVDAISEAADVSSRTFFNYFDSKEDAILGVRELALTDDAVTGYAEAVATDGLLETLMRMMFDILGPAISDSDLHKKRMEIARLHPQLFGRQLATMTKMTAELIAVIQKLMAHDAAFAETADSAQSAELLMGLCATAVRVTIKDWVAAGSDSPLTEVQTRAIALAREITEKLK